LLEVREGKLILLGPEPEPTKPWLAAMRKLRRAMAEPKMEPMWFVGANGGSKGNLGWEGVGSPDLGFRWGSPMLEKEVFGA
jgi:hypothetical protein